MMFAISVVQETALCEVRILRFMRILNHLYVLNYRKKKSRAVILQYHKSKIN